MSSLIFFVVEGSPTGKARPRFSSHGKRPRTYTPAETKSAETRVREAWRAAGSPTIPGPVPLEMTLSFHLARPKAHFLANGELSAAGRRSEYPVRKPDVDNLLKLVADALNGCAYQDDAQIVDAIVRRRWLDDPDGFERTRVQIRAMPLPAFAVAVAA